MMQESVQAPISGNGKRSATVQGFRRIAMVMSLLLLLGLFASCGSIHPAAKVAEGFFDAVSGENTDLWKTLLDPATKEQFEASMGDSELVSYLRDANTALSGQYGANWRQKVRVVSVELQKGVSVENGNRWMVAVSIDGDAGGKQDIPVLEQDGHYWLDLTLMDSGGTAN